MDVWNVITPPKTLEESMAQTAALLAWGLRLAQGKRVSADAVDIVDRKYNKGLPATQIAKDVGCNRDTVGRYLGIAAEGAAHANLALERQRVSRGVGVEAA